MNVIGYARLSRDTDASTSIERQREAIHHLALARGLNVVDIVEDVDVSATRIKLDDRPGMSALRARVAAGEASAVVVHRLDRLARNVMDYGVLLREGVQVISASESFDTTTPMGDAMVKILLVFAEMEARTIGMRVRSSQRQLREVGRFRGGPIGYGFRSTIHPSGVGRTLEVDPTEAAIVRRVVDELLAGRTLYAIAERLNQDDVPTRRPIRVDKLTKLETRRRWSATVLRAMLRNGTLLGWQTHTRFEARRDESGQEVTIRHVETVRDDKGLPRVFWSPIMSRDEFERVRALTEWTPTPGRGEQSAAGRRTRASRLLSGRILCPGCDRPLAVHAYANSPRRSTYSCGGKHRGWNCPGGVSVQCDNVEAQVERLFLAAVGRLQVVEARQRVREVAGLAEVEEAIRHTTDALRAPDADLADLVARLESLRGERERLDVVPLSPVVELVETGRTFSEAWAEADLLARQGLLDAAGILVRVAPRLVPGRARWDANRVSIEFANDYASALDYDG